MKNIFNLKVNESGGRFRFMPLILLSLLAAALGLRGFLLLTRPPLWLDEAKLAVNLLERGYAGLLTPLNSEQLSPIGFPLLSKFLGEISHYNEIVLSLPAFLAGLLLVYLAFDYWKKTKGRVFLFLTLALALNTNLIRHGAELKHYSFDALFSGLFLFEVLKGKGFTLKTFLLGILALLFSFAGIFSLFGYCVYSLFEAARERRRLAALKTCLYGLLWAGLFIFLCERCYLPGYRNLPLRNYWETGFFPLHAGLRDSAGWLFLTLNRSAFDPFSFALPGLLLLSVIVAEVKALPRVRVFSLSVFLAALAAAVFQVYPLANRTMVYLVPVVMYLCLEGNIVLQGAITSRTLKGALSALVLLSFISPFAVAPLSVPRDDVRSARREMLKEPLPAYVYYAADSQWRFYDGRNKGEAYPAEAAHGHMSRDNPADYARRIDEFAEGKAAFYLLHAHDFSGPAGSEYQLILAYLKNRFGKLAVTKYGGATLVRVTQKPDGLRTSAASRQ